MLNINKLSLCQNIYWKECDRMSLGNSRWKKKEEIFKIRMA
jgi:hypothetical protein